MVRFKLVFLLAWYVIAQWNVVCENEPGIDWSLYQKLQTLQIGLIQNKNLNEYVNSSDHLANDKYAFIDNKTSVGRPYNLGHCIKDLKTIQKASTDEKSNWVNESKQ